MRHANLNVSFPKTSCFLKHPQDTWDKVACYLEEFVPFLQSVPNIIDGAMIQQHTHKELVVHGTVFM